MVYEIVYFPIFFLSICLSCIFTSIYYQVCNIVCNSPIFSFKNIYTILKQMASLIFREAYSLESREILIAAIIQPVM